jgi:hypothetical protein
MRSLPMASLPRRGPLDVTRHLQRSPSDLSEVEGFGGSEESEGTVIAILSAAKNLNLVLAPLRALRG